MEVSAYTLSTDLDDNHLFLGPGPGFYDTMPVDPAPRRHVVERARVRAYRFEHYLKIDHSQLWQLEGAYLRGRVVDAATNAPVVGARLSTQLPNIASVRSGPDGNFELFVPERGAGAEILDGSLEAVCERAAEIIRDRGGVG